MSKNKSFQKQLQQLLDELGFEVTTIGYTINQRGKKGDTEKKSKKWNSLIINIRGRIKKKGKFL